MQHELPGFALLLAVAPCAVAGAATHTASPALDAAAAPPALRASAPAPALRAAAALSALRPPAAPSAPAVTTPATCPPLAEGSLTLAFDRALVRRLNSARFIVSGTYPATFSGQDVLRLPVTGGSLAAGDRVETGGALFLHAGTHRLSLSRFALRSGSHRTELLVRLGSGRTVALGELPPMPCTQPSKVRGEVRFTQPGSIAFRKALGAAPARIRRGASLAQLTLR